MATKKATTKKRSVLSSKTSSRTVAAGASRRRLSFSEQFNRDVSPTALIAETVGTFILVTVALSAATILNPLYLGLTLLVLMLAIGGISGAHVNPAVTFGLWTMRQIPLLRVPFYWFAQVVGAFASILTLTALSNESYVLNLSGFFNSFNWGVFSIEVIGMAVFMFGVAAAFAARAGMSDGSRALTYGLSFFVALIVSANLFANFSKSIDTASIQSVKDVPRALRVDSATLNPAIAIGAKEKTDAELGSSESSEADPASRLTLGETVAGSLLGAAIGGNLYLLLARNRQK